MKPRDALTLIVNNSGMSMRALSFSIGRSENFVFQTIKNKSVQKVDTMALIADAAGYDLLLRNRKTGSEIIIDPPK